jgi:ATP-dependent protease Clp ATPase subunit
MYELPNMENVEEVIITGGVVEGRSRPKIKYRKSAA